MNYFLDFDNWLDSDFIKEILENIVNFSWHLCILHNETILMIFQQSADLWNNVSKYGIWDLFVNFSIVHFSVRAEGKSFI